MQWPCLGDLLHHPEQTPDAASGPAGPPHLVLLLFLQIFLHQPARDSCSNPKSVPHWLCDLGRGPPTWASVSPSVEWAHLGLVRAI